MPTNKSYVFTFLHTTYCRNYAHHVCYLAQIYCSGNLDYLYILMYTYTTLMHKTGHLENNVHSSVMIMKSHQCRVSSAS